MEEPQRPGFAGVTEAHIESWRTQGYCVFEQIIPPALLEELRSLTDAARGEAMAAQRTASQQALARKRQRKGDACLHALTIQQSALWRVDKRRLSLTRFT